MGNRWTNYRQGDTPWQTDGDLGFRGIDMFHDRGSLPQGYLARGENKRLRDGVAATRPGTTYSADFNPPFDNTINGSHIYSNPNGEEVMLVSTASATYVWALQFGKDPVKVQLETGQSTGSGLVHFVQAFDKVLLLRYPFSAGPVLVWDGHYANQFVPITLSARALAKKPAGTEVELNPRTGLALIPQTIDGVPFANRVLLFNPYYAPLPWRDQLVMTDVLDYTSYDNILGVFRINAGESDLITSVFPYFKGAVVVFMRDSVHLLEDFTVDPTLARQRLLSDRIGSVGYRGPLMVGSDVIFLSRAGGYYRLSEILDNQIVTPPIPISRNIQPIIDRIDYDRATIYHSSALLDEYAFFAVPLDHKNGAADAVLALNTITNEWESAPDWWDDSRFRLNRLLVTLYNGRKRLFGLDYSAQKIYLLYEGLADEVLTGGESVPVRDVIETRGYGDKTGYNRFQRVSIGLRSYDPVVGVTAISDGFNEEKELALITKDRLRFYVHGHPPFDPALGDPNEPKREDYSFGIDDFAIEDFEGLPEGPVNLLPGTPLIFTNNKQQSLERFQVRQNGRWCSIRIANISGQCDVLGVGVDAMPAQEGIKRLA